MNNDRNKWYDLDSVYREMNKSLMTYGMDKKLYRIPDQALIPKEFKAEIDRNGFHRITAKNYGETYEIEAKISRDGRVQIKLRIWPAIGKDKIIEKLEAGKTKRGVIIKLDPENLHDIPAGHYYPELIHENEHFPVNEHMEHWRKIGLLKAI